MTDIGSLQVETQALVAFGRERGEDAMIAYMANVAIARKIDIPQEAFGDFHPETWRYWYDWYNLRQARETECKSVSKALWGQYVALVEIAADYEKTDIEGAFTIEEAASGLEGELEGFSKKDLQINHDRGSTPDFPDYDGSKLGDAPEFETPKLIKGEPYMAEITISGHKTGEVYSDGRPKPTKVEVEIQEFNYDHGRESDELTNFIDNFRQELELIEAVAAIVGSKRPLSDLIFKAWQSSPTVIRDAANECESIANVVEELHEEFKSEKKNLQNSWWGVEPSADRGQGAAGIYYELADSTIEYIKEQEHRLRWMAQQARTVSKKFQTLRTTLGQEGSKKIQETREAMAENIASLVEKDEKGMDLLKETINAFVGALTNATSGNIEEMSRAFDVEAIITNKDDAYTGDSKEYSEPKSLPDNINEASWKDSENWDPKDNHPDTFDPNSDSGKD